MVKGSSHKKIVFLIVLFACSIGVIGQSCTIISKNEACLGDIVSFSVNTTGTPISYQWKFGSVATSTQPKPSYNFTAHNTYTIEVTIGFPGGGSCVATKTLTIHPKPISNFSFSQSNSYCFSNQNICIDDISTPGPTGNPIVQRVFLWDDGAGDNTNNPAAQKKLCHKYFQAGTYSLVMETTDDKGCQSKSNKQVTILPDFDIKLTHQILISPGTCKYKICMQNKTVGFDKNQVDEFLWDFGDGTTNNGSTSMDSICHDYANDGSYTALLRIKHKSGCIDTVSVPVNVVNPKFEFNLKTDTICYGDLATFFNDASNPGAQYRWFVRDSSTGLERPLDKFSNPVQYSPLKPGKFIVKLNMLSADGCIKNGYDTLVVKGPKAEFIMRNAKQCTPGDTTYFCDKSDYYRAYHIKRLWDFEHGASCTTDTEKGLNIGANCRYSKDISPKHLYDYKKTGDAYSCYTAKLLLTDTVTGCEDETQGAIKMGLYPKDSISITQKGTDYCTDIGSQNPERTILFNIKGFECDGWDLFMNYDSANNIADFRKVSVNPPPANIYPGTGNPNGDVTMGFVIRNGDTARYSSCNQTMQTQGQFCADTLWYHKMFNIAKVPNPYTQFFTGKICAPFNSVIRPEDTIQYGVKKMVWDWGDGTKDSIEFGPNDTIIPERTHGYPKNGAYTQIISMYNTRGCREDHVLQIGLGYQNFVAFDTMVCAGDSVELVEFISYYDKADRLWQDSARNAQNKETVRWDFGDGNFVYKKPEEKVVFPKQGVYQVRMATKDSTGCIDTFKFEIIAVGADANIKSMRDTFYCNDNIIRFYDSSFGSPQIPGDIATQWNWNFGDGKPISFLKDPFHFYTSYGAKGVTLSIISKEGCRDTTSKVIFIVGPEPFFEIITDSIGCEPHKVTFKNTSNRVRTWIWNLGDPANTSISTDVDSNITFTYVPPGVYNVTLYGGDSIFNPNTGNTYFCETTYPDTPFVKQVRVIPNYPVGIDIPDTLCENVPFTVKSTSAARYDRFRWWMGNNDSIFTDSFQFQYAYDKIGQYRIDFKPTFSPSPIERLCITDTFKNVTVVPIKSQFSIAPSSRAPIFNFINESRDAVRYEWDFGHPKSGGKNKSRAVHPSHNYGLDTGTFNVCLIAYNQEDCPDTFCLTVVNDYVPRFSVPNVFTPNKNDDLNNRFDIDIHFPLLYELTIFNRWGEKVFESNEDGAGWDDNDTRNWDGIHYLTGEPCPEGVYFVVLNYEILGFNKKDQYSGTLTLFRNQ